MDNTLGITPQPGLVQLLLNDSEGDPDKLPVLQHLLKRLWEDRSDGHLDLGLYEHVGGWEHALERDAEKVLSEFASEERGVRRMFQWLGDLGTGDKPVRRRRPVAELPGVSGLDRERVESVLSEFGKRDFVRFEDGDSKTVDFVHESVMWQWPKLKRWIEEEATEASRLRFLHEAAVKQLPLTGATLEYAQALRNRMDASPEWAPRYFDNPADVRSTLDWISESERRQKDELAELRRRQRLLLGALAGATVLVVLIAWLGWRAYTSKHAAEEQLSMNYWTEAHHAASESGRGPDALYLAVEAIRVSPPLEENVLLDMRAIWPIYALKNMVAHQGPVRGAVFSRDESRILTWSDDKTAQVWDARTGQPLGPALQHAATVNGALFSRDESRILTWSGDVFASKGEARLWDARTGQPLGPALQHAGAVYGALFSRDENRILTWSSDKTARLWDARTGQPLGPALQHTGAVNGALFSRDESRIVTWSADKTARIWPIDIDLDFPAEYLSVWLRAMTGTDFDIVSRQEKTLSPPAWREIRQRYEQIAAAHAKECKYPEFNEWLHEQH